MIVSQELQDRLAQIPEVDSYHLVAHAIPQAYDGARLYVFCPGAAWHDSFLLRASDACLFTDDSPGSFK
jgi:hypothetical protein